MHTSGTFSEIAMAKTRGAKSSSPSTRLRIPRESLVQAAIPEPPWPLVVPPLTRIQSLNQSLNHLNHRSKSPTVSAILAISQRVSDSLSMTPEVVIRHPMVTQPPIEGNLDCRQGHSTLSSVLTQLLSDFSLSSGFLPSTTEVPYGALADSQGFFLSPRSIDFYKSVTTHQVRDPTVIHFTIDGRHGILGARHIAEALHIPYEPARPKDYRVWTHPT
ncbi:hypothetical protein CK203_064868 [Vitis vinifera]|uniref:Uncharacterized protein n=1 Tax=Vitis vinifera TaxID=29760 RepID=A0A438FP98_VITVI|nr:hypothetical protein CK203_064868 [Vitis vinifera]